MHDMGKFMLEQGRADCLDQCQSSARPVWLLIVVDAGSGESIMPPGEVEFEAAVDATLVTVPQPANEVLYEEMPPPLPLPAEEVLYEEVPPPPLLPADEVLYEEVPAPPPLPCVLSHLQVLVLATTLEKPGSVVHVNKSLLSCDRGVRSCLCEKRR